jgi:hypothetical protein
VTRLVIGHLAAPAYVSKIRAGALRCGRDARAPEGWLESDLWKAGQRRSVSRWALPKVSLNLICGELGSVDLFALRAQMRAGRPRSRRLA